MRRWIAGLLTALMLMQTSAAAFQTAMVTPLVVLGSAEASHAESVQASQVHSTHLHHLSLIEASSQPCDEHTQTGSATCTACLACCFLTLPSSHLYSPAPSFFISAPFVLLDDTFRSYWAPDLERPPQLPFA